MTKDLYTNEDILEALRSAQEGQRTSGPGNFTEWRAERPFAKAPGGYSPGFGLMGHMNTSSRAPAGPNSRRSGNNAVGLKQFPQQFGVPSGVTYNQSQSQYANMRPNQPPPWIDDVDMASIWYCYDKETEILTSHRGWQKFSALTEDDSVATLNASLNAFEWQKPIQRPTLDYVGQLIQFKAEGADLVVTPNHNMVVNYLPYKACAQLNVPKQQGVGTYLLPAALLEKTINHHVKMPVTVGSWQAHTFPTMLVPADRSGENAVSLQPLDYCAFLGLYLSEGSCGQGRVQIWQKRDGARWQEIADILYEIFGERVKYIDHLGSRDDPGYFIIYSKALVEHLSQFGDKAGNKIIPLALRNASKACLFAFVKAYMLGDGEYSLDNKKTNYREMRLPPKEIRGRITTASKQIADALQEIVLKLGYSARIETMDRQTLIGHKIKHPDGSFNEIKSVQTAYRVRIIGTTHVGNFAISRVDYTGKVYCVTVPNGIVYVRRNGKPCWSGNSPMEPVWPFGPPNYTVPREWNFPVGYNLNYIQPRMELMGTLRGMRKSWGILATIIETRKDQMLRVPWTIQVRNKPRASSKFADEMRRFFKRPDGKLTYSQWSRKYLDDLFVVDAPSIYLDRDRGGRMRNAQVIDGASIFPLIDDTGRRPDTDYEVGSDGIMYERRQPAFQQIIYGLPMINLSEDELIYGMMRPRPEMPMFGYSQVEQIMVEATEAIRKTFYQLEFWRAGSMPELIVTVPDVWTPRQIATFQAHFDAVLSGQLTLKSKVRFVPGGMKPFDIKNASGESLWSQRDELLVRLCCYAFSVSPTPFVHQTNRATANQAQESANEEGLYPLMSYWKDDVMDTIIQEKFGYDDIEFVYLPRPEADQSKQATIHQVRIHDGVMTINESREELGLEPVEDGDHHLIYTGSTVLRLDQVISGEAIAPGSPTPAGPATPAAPSGRSVAPIRGPAKPRQDSPTPSTVHKRLKGKDIAAIADETNRHPSKMERKLGNYKKGKLSLHGLPISLENAKGSRREEKDRFGVKQGVKMPAAYGYIRGTLGADGMQVDCYLGKHPASPTVWIIDQDKFDVNGDDKGFDEHKVMLAFKTFDKAVEAYMKSHYDGMGHERLAAVTQLSYDELKAWLKKGDMHRPISEQGVGHVVARRGVGGGITKADTISQGKNLLSYSQISTSRSRRKAKRKLKRKLGAKWLELCA